MVMAGKIKLPFQWRILLGALCIGWLLMGTYMYYLYHREKEYKQRMLDGELQFYNAMVSDLVHRSLQSDSMDVRSAAVTLHAPLKDLRLTLVDADGKVIYDSSNKVSSVNHNGRPEIMRARTTGQGRSVERVSESDAHLYFYSALLADSGIVVRSALPYTHTLRSFLSADKSIFWIMGCMTLLMTIVAVFATRKMSLSIKRLNRFAENAERGGPVSADLGFPDDELGSIASHIVRLYVQRDEQHREALRQEQEKIRLKKQLTNNINHELKTPVASILLCLELLRSHPELSADQKEKFSDSIESNARRLNALLTDVATLTRMDDGASVISRESVDVADVVADVVAEKRLQTDMTISVDVSPFVIDGNRPLLESVFRNLIDNSIAYSGGTRITVTGDATGHYSVFDDGRGVPPESLPHIFERFYRVDKGRSRAVGGTGLGLAIVRNSIVMHGGKVHAVNDNGLRVNFTLA